MANICRSQMNFISGRQVRHSALALQRRLRHTHFDRCAWFLRFEVNVLTVPEDRLISDFGFRNCYDSGVYLRILTREICSARAKQNFCGGVVSQTGS